MEPNSKDSNDAPRRSAIIVAGMHRSGTSALTGALAKLGCTPPMSIMPPNENNPRGYWESMGILRFHEDLLLEIGSRWSDWSRPDSNLMALESVQQLVDGIPKLIERQFGGADNILIKDPRICRFLNIWIEALGSLGYATKIVIPVRNPLEVAASLKKRDDFPIGLSLLVWLRHVLDAEFASRACKRTFLNYKMLLGDWRKTLCRVGDDLNLEWPLSIVDAESEIDTFLATEMHHQRVKPGSLKGCSQITALALEAEDLLSRLACTPADESVLASLDEMRRHFDSTSALFNSVVSELESEWNEARTKHLVAEEQNAELIDKEALLAKSLAAVNEECKKVRESKSAIVMELRGAGDDARELIATQQFLQEELSTYRQKYRDVCTTNSELHAVTKRYEQQFEELTESGQRFEQEISALERKVQVGEARNSELAEQASKLEARNVELEQRVRQLKSENEKCKGVILRASSHETTMAQSLDRRFAEIASLTRLAESQSQQLDMLEANLQSIQKTWLWKIVAACRTFTPVFGRRPRSSNRLLEHKAIIEASGLFDQDWYRSQYPDVAASQCDPVLHYLEYGASEGRSPNRYFNTIWYLEKNPDVIVAELNPLVHYILHGQHEGRKTDSQ